MDYNKIMKELAEYVRIQEEAKAKAEELKSLLKDYMETQHTDTLAGTEHKATYKPVQSTRIDGKRLQAEKPETYREYVIQGVTMRFTFK